MPLKPKKPHIVSDLLEKDCPIDTYLSKLSKEIFELDNTNRIILSTIGKYGTLNEYQIFKKTQIPVSTVRRRIVGRENISKTLQEQEFVIQTPGTRLPTGRTENRYTLTLKGLLSSLSHLKFEEYEMVKSFHVIFSNKFDSKYEMPDLIIQLIKYQIALFMIWHKINGSNLAPQKNSSQRFLEWNTSNVNLSLKYPSPFIIDDELEKAFIQIRTRFFVLESLVTFFLNKLNAQKEQFVVTYDDGERCDSTPYFNLVKYWPYYLEQIQLEPFSLYKPGLPEYDALDEVGIDELRKGIIKLQKKSFKKMDIQKYPDIFKQKLLWKIH